MENIIVKLLLKKEKNQEAPYGNYFQLVKH